MWLERRRRRAPRALYVRCRAIHENRDCRRRSGHFGCCQKSSSDATTAASPVDCRRHQMYWLGCCKEAARSDRRRLRHVESYAVDIYERVRGSVRLTRADRTIAEIEAAMGDDKSEATWIILSCSRGRATVGERLNARSEHPSSR